MIRRDHGRTIDSHLSYEARARFASLSGLKTLSQPWFDLAIHQKLWQAAHDWWNQGDPVGQLRVEAGAGTGKTLWANELHRRLRHFRPYLITAEFAPGEEVDPRSIHQKWATHLCRGVEMQPLMEIRDWVKLALNVLATDGYRPLLVIEADDTAEGNLPDLPLIYLQRLEFEGFKHQCPVLAPWSNDELAMQLGRAWPELNWPEQTVEQIWMQTKGQPRLAMNLARRLANQAQSTVS